MEVEQEALEDLVEAAEALLDQVELKVVETQEGIVLQRVVMEVQLQEHLLKLLILDQEVVVKAM
tara:strand:+ start:377 stop:568 length:192 start_codon:yes stop_codon:yes gene_type:complete